MKKANFKIVEKIVKFATVNSANSTTSGAMFQPKAPDELKKFSKIDNDK